MQRIFKYSLLKLLKSWQLYLLSGLGLFIFAFVTFALPISINIQLTVYYGAGPSWITITWPAAVIIVCLLSSAIGELNANKKQMIYIIAKDLKRSQYLFSKFMSTLLVTLFLTILIFAQFLIIEEICVAKDATHPLFTSSVTWYNILIFLVVVCVLASGSTIYCYQIVVGVTTLILVVITAVAVLFFPMVWYVDNPGDPDNHRLWYTFYMSLVLFLPIAIIAIVSFSAWFCKKRINL